MISIDDNGKYSLRNGSLLSFLAIIQEQYKVYYDFVKKENRLNVKTPEELLRLNQNQIDPLYICTIFTALYLEAFIYDYTARKHSTSLAKRLDKLSPPDKWVVATELCNKKAIDTSSSSYEQLTKLFKFRNNLAHNKSILLDLENFNNDNKIKLLEPLECVDIIINILTELINIDKAEIYAPIVIKELSDLKISYSNILMKK